jgi:putative sugar O-methyltransferase
MTENAFWTETKSKFNESDLNVFKTWNSVRSVPLYADSQFENYYGGDIIQITKMLHEEDRKIVYNALREPFTGHNHQSYNNARRIIPIDGQELETTAWSLKSLHHALVYNASTGKRFSDYEQIVEFGAGIGDTCRVIHDLGYTGPYYIYDLPEVLRISTFYNPFAKGVTHYSEVPNDKKTLFIGTWSISEVPPDYRTEVFTHFKDADYLLIYQNKAFEYDNKDYFENVFPKIITGKLQTFDIPWLSHIAEGNKYLITI